MHRSEIVTRIERERVVAVLRLADPDKLRAAIDALAAGGVRIFEVTMTVPGAIKLIDQLARDVPADVIVGAGTVIDVGTARLVVNAGAMFVVSPVYKREVIDACHNSGVAAIPGCFTPTEILDAWEAGADIVKVFPSTALGPAFIKDVRAPLPQLKLMPTGGVSIDNAADWLRAGAVAVGIGSALVDDAAVTAGDFAALTERAERLMASIKSIRLTTSAEATVIKKADTTA